MEKGNLSKTQKGLIHKAAVKLGLIRHMDYSQYRLVLKNICGVKSSTQMTQLDYDKLALYFDSCGVSISSIINQKSQIANCSSRQLYKIKELQKELPTVNIPGVIKQFLGVVTEINDLSPREAGKLISALQDIKSRRDGSRRDDIHPVMEDHNHEDAASHQLDRRKVSSRGEVG